MFDIWAVAYRCVAVHRVEASGSLWLLEHECGYGYVYASFYRYRHAERNTQTVFPLSYKCKGYSSPDWLIVALLYGFQSNGWGQTKKKETLCLRTHPVRVWRSVQVWL